MIRCVDRVAQNTSGEMLIPNTRATTDNSRCEPIHLAFTFGRKGPLHFLPAFGAELNSAGDICLTSPLVRRTYPPLVGVSFS